MIIIIIIVQLSCRWAKPQHATFKSNDLGILNRGYKCGELVDIVLAPLKQLNLKDGHFSLPVNTVTQPTKMTVSRWKLSVELLECVHPWVSGGNSIHSHTQ